VALGPFVVGVARLRTQLGATAECHLEAAFDPSAELAATSPGESEVPPGALARFDGMLESIPKGIVASGTVGAPWRGVCRRCAAPTGGELSAFLRERHLESATADDEAYLLEGDLLDLGPMIRDAIVLELPLAPLCREDCKGLCASCGADLNEEGCGCEGPGDPRWATLDVLRRPD
jgi:uncharacterized protein